MQSESNKGSVANDFLLALVRTSQEPATSTSQWLSERTF